MLSVMPRRQFLGMGVGTLAGTLLAPSLLAAESSSANPSQARDSATVYADALVLDANTLASIGGIRSPEDLRVIRASGINALKSTLGGSGASFEETVADIAAAQQLIERHPELFLKVLGHADLARAKGEGRIAVIFSFEAASMLEDKVDRIDLFRDLDVRVMQLSYNRGSGFGAGSLDDEAAGLTPLGREAIARMNARGVALDLSHSNARTTREAIAACQRPALITHAGCRAVFDHPRNKADAELRALADKGGVVGIYMLPFLTEDTRQPMLADYLDHLVHALGVCGEDHVGIGTDSLFFSVTDEDIKAMDALMRERAKAGTGAPGENRTPYLPDVNTPRKLEHVADGLLRRGYPARVVEKVLGANFARAFGEAWREA
jgi:membrane dipeptidase